jgi:hypothetical protein
MLRYVGRDTIKSMYDLNLSIGLHEKLMLLTGNRHTLVAVKNLITEMQCVHRLNMVRFDTDNRAL